MQLPSTSHLKWLDGHALPVVEQFCSSSPLGQSKLLSHNQADKIHCPVLHRNWLLLQRTIGGRLVGDTFWGTSGTALEQPASSLPSPQSFTSSHFHQNGMQRSFLHLNIHSWHVSFCKPVINEVGKYSTRRVTWEGRKPLANLVPSVLGVVQLSSSLPSAQSRSPSQSHVLKMQRFCGGPHENWNSLHTFSVHPVSSEPSLKK